MNHPRRPNWANDDDWDAEFFGRPMPGRGWLGAQREERLAWFAEKHGGRGGPHGPFGHGGPRGPFGPGGPGRQRQRRGDIKFALLELLQEQPRHGYELIKELENRYGGFYRPSPGSVYPTLQLLEDEGHLTSDTVDGKRVYTITESGIALLEERRNQSDADDPRRGPPMQAQRPELRELREGASALIAAVMQTARHGTPEQIAAAQSLLDSTRRELYRILAADPADEAE